MPAFIERKVTFQAGNTIVTVDAKMPDADVEEYARDLLRDIEQREFKLISVELGSKWINRGGES